MSITPNITAVEGGPTTEQSSAPGFGFSDVPPAL
jgi:hypothetical protein